MRTKAGFVVFGTHKDGLLDPMGTPFIDQAIIDQSKEALKARDIAARQGVRIRVIVLEKLRPTNNTLDALRELIPQNAKTVFLEEGVRNGGCGMLYASLFAKCGLDCEVLALREGITAFQKDEHPYKTLGIASEDILSAFSIRVTK